MKRITLAFLLALSSLVSSASARVSYREGLIAGYLSENTYQQELANGFIDAYHDEEVYRLMHSIITALLIEKDPSRLEKLKVLYEKIGVRLAERYSDLDEEEESEE